MEALKLVEEPRGLGEIVAELIATTEARKLARETSFSPRLAEIALALAAEASENDDARRLRGLARLREDAARAHAIRVGKLLIQIKAEVPHGQFGDWVKQNFKGRNAAEYMRLARRGGKYEPGVTR